MKQLHFSQDEFDARLSAVRKSMRAQGLEALLLFAQESMYWLTGYDTFGFCFFQCMIVTPDQPTRLLTRSADLRQARFTSTLKDDEIHIWKDGAGVDPTADLANLLSDMGLQGARIGAEFDTQGLTAHHYRLLAARYGDLQDASHLVPALRLVKSPAEIAYVRKAAELGDAVLEAGIEAVRPGADEGAILDAMQGANFRLGGDYPGNEFIIGSGPGALLCRYYSGRRTLEAQDQITLEFAGVWRHYHAALMRTLLTGQPRKEHINMHEAAREALLACEAAIKPGQPMRDVFEAHSQTLDKAGLSQHRLNACGYSLGARFTPCWMDPPMFYEGAPQIMAEDMVFFLHMILMDSDSGAAMCLGRTSLVTASGAEPLSRASLDLISR